MAGQNYWAWKGLASLQDEQVGQIPEHWNKKTVSQSRLQGTRPRRTDGRTDGRTDDRRCGECTQFNKYHDKMLNRVRNELTYVSGE